MWCNKFPQFKERPLRKAPGFVTVICAVLYGGSHAPASPPPCHCLLCPTRGPHTCASTVHIIKTSFYIISSQRDVPSIMRSQTDGSDSSSTPRPDPATSDSAKGSSLPTRRPCAAVFAFLVGPHYCSPLVLFDPTAGNSFNPAYEALEPSRMATGPASHCGAAACLCGVEWSDGLAFPTTHPIHVAHLYMRFRYGRLRTHWDRNRTSQKSRELATCMGRIYVQKIVKGF